MEAEIFAKILNIPKLPEYLDQVDRRIRDLFSDANPNIRAPVYRLLDGLGKPERAFLVISAALCQGGVVDDSVIAGSAAIELANIGVSVHDDIMDDAESRWGVNSVNAQEGIGQAILVGDYLLALAIDQANVVDSRSAKIIIDSITTMINGQSQETADRYNLGRDREAYLASIQMKSAALTAAACQIGGLCAALPPAQVKSLHNFGMALGTVMQIVDDLLDLLSTEKLVGKPVDRDIREGVYTLPIILALRGRDGNRIRTMLNNLPKGENAPPGLLKLLISSGAIDQTFREARLAGEIAASSLNDFEKNKLVDGLSRLPYHLMDIGDMVVRLR